MIIVRLKGGLGNQMFEYAAGRAMALATGARLLLDATFLNDRTPRHITFRSYELGIFTIAPEFTFLSRLSFLLPIPFVWPAFSVCAEKIGALFGRKMVYLKDYFQSEKYFSDHAGDIRNDFTFKNPLSPAAEKIAAEIASTESVCLHVRRGDYVSDTKTAAHHGFAGDGGYYGKAIETIGEKIANPRFFVFSDDMEWCRKNLGIRPAVFVPASADDLHLMSLCKHDIIANSSFSWWGAWLNKNPHKIVIAPKRWLRGETCDSGDIVPVSWIRI